MALAQVNPGIIMSGQPFTPVTSYLQGLEFRQKAEEAKQLQGLRGLQIENEKAQMQENLMMQPYRLQQVQQNLDIGKQGLDVGQYQFGKEKEQDLRSKRVDGVIGKFVGETGKLPYNDPLMQKSFISEISKEDPKIAIEYSKHFDEIARAKSQAEALAKQQDFENTIKWKKMLNDNARLDFDKLKMKFDMEAPFRNEAINQQFLNQELSGNLASKRNPDIRLTENKLKDVTERSVKTPQVIRIITDLNTDIAKYGTEQAPTEIKARMESNLKTLQGILKSEKFINLGVLTGPDLEFLNSITGDPTGWSNWNADRVSTRLNTVKNNTLQEFNTAMQNNGFKPFSEQEVINLIPGAKSSVGSNQGQTQGKRIDVKSIAEARAMEKNLNPGDTLYLNGMPVGVKE